MFSKTDKNAEKEQPYDGITLAYNGMRFIPSSFVNNKFSKDNSELSPLEALTERFKAFGALLIRFHLSQGQRAGLLQQISKSTYSENPVEKPALGKDDINIFFPNENHHNNDWGQFLEYCSHQPLGRSKVLNERAQPLVHVNVKGTYGEQGLWDLIHAPVWNVGRSLKFELNSQGFVYIACPSYFTPLDRSIFSHKLYETGTSYEDVFGKASIEIEKTNIQKLNILLDDKKQFTHEENGLAIATPDNKQPAPLGWIVDQKTGAVLPEETTEDIIRVMAIAEGGFYEKSPAQQKILQSGNLLNKNGKGLFTQNQAFNAVYVVLKQLESYKFDPRSLLDYSMLLAYQRIQKFIQDDPSSIDDFLVGSLQDEMVQTLRVTQGRSKRSALPLRFTNPFEVSYNNLKAIAYAFDLKDSAGQPIFKNYDDTPIIGNSSKLIDAEVNGSLVTPSFNSGVHVAAVIATSVLIAEQMILEQLIPEAANAKDIKNCSLYNILNQIHAAEKASEILNQILTELPDFPKEGNTPILGVQFDYCQKMLQMIRSELGLAEIVPILTYFAIPGTSTDEAMSQMGEVKSRQLTNALLTLNLIGNELQKSSLTSAQSENSRGINAGITPLLARLYPQVSSRIGIKPDEIAKADVKPISKELANARISAKTLTFCPFISGIGKQSEGVQGKHGFFKVDEKKGALSEKPGDVAPSSQHSANNEAHEKSNTDEKHHKTAPTSHGFFSTAWEYKGTIGTFVATAAIATAAIISYT